MTLSTSAGTQLGVTATPPATFNAAGYGASTFTDIGNLEKLGAIGPVYTKNEFQPLKGPKKKSKGTVDYGSLSPSMAYDPDDAGQMILATASESNADYYFKATYPNGEIKYFPGMVFGFPVDAEGADSFIMANPTIEINDKPITVPPGS